MTTPVAAASCLAQHRHELRGRKVSVHNPKNKPVDELPVIFGFNNGGSPGWLDAILIAEDGTVLGSHCCSHESYMPHDLGILEGTRSDRHETFREHYPDGYRMQFVGYSDLQDCAPLNAALEKYGAAKENQHE